MAKYNPGGRRPDAMARRRNHIVHVTDPDENRDTADNGGVTTARLLAVLWSNLVDVLGTAAAATVLRRAIKRACVRQPELEELRVVRERWEYRCTTPEGWDKRVLADTPAFVELIRSELYPLLRELTGPIVLRRLQRVPELREVGLFEPEEK